MRGERFLTRQSNWRFELVRMVLGNSTEWIFTLGDYTEPNKLDFIIPTGYNARWKVNKCTEMDENKVESGKIP